MSDSVDFFIHVPKTGGTTMSRIILAQYPRGTALVFGKADHEQRGERIANLSPGVRIVSGHLHYGWAKKFPRPCRSFTVLRDPIERAISDYFFTACDPTHRLHEEVRSGRITVQELARQHSDMQARYIAGYKLNDDVPDDVLLAEARENLARKLIAFGLTERFDQTLLIFNQVLGWNVRHYARSNVTRNRPGQEATARKDIERIREYNAVDLAFYEFARELFEERLAAQPLQFGQQLATLRRNVKIVERLNRIRDGLARLKRAVGMGG